LADKKAAKRRRRENKEVRDKAKAERTGPSLAQQAEAVRNVEAEDPREAEPRTGGRLGGRRHRQQQPTVAVIRSASASTSRAATSSGRDPVVLGGDAAGRATVVDATPAEAIIRTCLYGAAPRFGTRAGGRIAPASRLPQ